MGLAFKNEMHDEFGSWPVAYIPYGGADLGEILAVGRAVGEGDDTAYYDSWVAAAGRMEAEAAGAEGRGLRQSAGELFLRASAFYAAAYHPLYGSPVDPRLVAAFRKQMAAFGRGLALSGSEAQAMRIPFEGSFMPGWFIPAAGRAREVRPLIVLTNGYDATITDLYFASAVAAGRRGYHCLIFDGPGQGGMLYEQGIHLRPDWETIVKAVVDAASEIPCVDPERIALSGWSLGGYLAPRAASGERRIAACIADPGQRDLASPFRALAERFGAAPEAGMKLSELDEQTLEGMMAFIRGNPRLKWKIVQRGFWVHGVEDLRGYLRELERFTMEGRVEAVSCPTLMTLAENDPLAAGTQAFFDELRCPKALLRFSAAEGAGDHCEMGNRSLLNRRVLDWLDEVMPG